MTGPHRVKTRAKTKLRGPQFAFNEEFTQEDKVSQNSLLPVHSLSLSASQKRGETSRRLVSKEFSKLSAFDRATLNDWVDDHPGESFEDPDHASIPDEEQPRENEECEDDRGDSIAMSLIPPSRYRSWIERTHNASAAWSSQYEELADAYLQYKASLSPNSDPPVHEAHKEDSCELETFLVEGVDLFAREPDLSFTHPRNEHRNVTLARAGYISPSPTNPTTAISIRTLEIFKALRRRMPQFSVQAFAKTLCDLHSVPYKRYLREQLSATLDVYFTVLRIIDSRLLAALKRDGPDWRLKNACPACTYKLEEELVLKPSMMACGDGNVSLKRYVRSSENDPCTFNMEKLQNTPLPLSLESPRCTVVMLCTDMILRANIQLRQANIHSPVSWFAKTTQDLSTGLFTDMRTNVHANSNGIQCGDQAWGWRISKAASDFLVIQMELLAALSTAPNILANMAQLEESLAHRNHAMDAFDIREEDFARFIDEERDYLRSLSSELPGNNDAIDYVSALEDGAKLQNQLDKLLKNPLALFANQDLRVDIDKAIAAERRKLTSQINLNYQLVHDLEIKLDVTQRWTNNCPEWKQAVEDRSGCELQHAADNMERLCLERIFELEKYLQGNTGYKLRELIEKSLSTRSKALKSAVTRYNTLARNFNPPRKEVSTSEVMDMTKYSDFKLLREHRQDILVQKWTLPEVREATTHALRVDRAREELARVQVEARRLQTWARDDLYHMAETLKKLGSEQPLLAEVLRPQIAYHTRINEVTLSYVRRIEQSHYFSGKPGCGTRPPDADWTGFTPMQPILDNGGDMDIDAGPSDDESDGDIETELANLTEAYDRIASIAHI
ncbi:hypothetical protein FRC07_004303 [Ceratobasidium sp. 392]|nr:hypothetical protein FRC07_004303 [Ceratobasidium sp. 392]